MHIFQSNFTGTGAIRWYDFSGASDITLEYIASKYNTQIPKNWWYNPKKTCAYFVGHTVFSTMEIP